MREAKAIAVPRALATTVPVLATMLATATLLAACTDLRDFRGDWHGYRVGDAAAVRVGVTDTAEATLAIETIDTHGLHATIAIDKIFAPTAFASLDGAEADRLANLTFAGDPIRVYLGFAPVVDGAGDALVMIALYDDRRVEIRLLRGGPTPLYGIFDLSPGAS